MNVKPLEIIDLANSLIIACTDDSIDNHAEVVHVTDTLQQMSKSGELIPYLESKGLPRGAYLDKMMFAEIVWAMTYALSAEQGKPNV